MSSSWNIDEEADLIFLIGEKGSRGRERGKWSADVVVAGLKFGLFGWRSVEGVLSLSRSWNELLFLGSGARGSGKRGSRS